MSTQEDRSLFWVNLSDEALIRVREDQVRPGDRNTFNSAKRSAIFRLYKAHQEAKLKKELNGEDLDRTLRGV